MMADAAIVPGLTHVLEDLHLQLDLFGHELQPKTRDRLALLAGALGIEVDDLKGDHADDDG